MKGARVRGCSSGADCRVQGQLRTGHWSAGAGGEVEARHLPVAILLIADELPLVHHARGQAFDGVGVQVAWNSSVLPAACTGFLKFKLKKKSCKSL